VTFRDGSDVVETPGVNFGGTVRLVYRAGPYCVLRTSAGSHWAGIGSRSTHRSCWKLVRVERVITMGLSGCEFTRDRATVITEREPGRDWRYTKSIFIARAAALALELP